MMKKPLILLLFALLYYMPITLMAQCSMGGNLFTFTNGKGDSLWSQEANWDLMQVPGVNDCVLIESPHSVIFDVTSAMIREMTVNGAELSINAGTTLSIFEGVFDQSETTIENTGEISFTYITGTDWQLVNNGKLHSVFPLHTSHTLAFTGNSVLVNNDSITGLPNMLWSGSEFINAEDAFIHAQIEVHDDVQNMGTIKGAWTLDIQRGLFENKGSISFSNFTYTDGPVIHIGGCPDCTELRNTGSISIRNLDGGSNGQVEIIGIRVGLGKLVNENYIYISNITHESVFKTVGIHLTQVSEFNNKGDISMNHIQGPGIRSVATHINAVNNGFIHMDSVGLGNEDEAAIALVQEANLAGGFTNNEFILIEEPRDGIFTRSDQEFINNGTVRILDHLDIAVRSAYITTPYVKYHQEGRFVNQTFGTLDVINLTQPVINALDTWFENSGQLTISIPNLVNNTAIKGVMINHGDIDVTVAPSIVRNSFVAKLLNYSGATFQSNSNMQIDSFHTNTLPKPFNEGSITTTGHFYTTDDFKNKACGYMQFSEPYSNGTNDFTNDGVMRIEDCCDSGNNFVFLENNGIVVDTTGGLLAEPGFINNGVHIDTDPGMYSSGDILTQITQGPNTAKISDPMLTTDAAGTNPAGTFDLSTGEIILGNNIDGADTLFAHFNMPGGCTTAVAILGSPLSCGACATNTWTGNTSTDWHQASNWSLNQIPVNCQHVIIPDNAANNCIISNGNTGECSTLETETGAVLEVNGEINVGN